MDLTPSLVGTIECPTSDGGSHTVTRGALSSAPRVTVVKDDTVTRFWGPSPIILVLPVGSQRATGHFLCNNDYPYRSRSLPHCRSHQPAPACCSTIPAKAGIAAREDVFWGTSNLLTARNDDIATLWGGASAETGTAKSWQRSGGAQVAVGGREMTVAKSKVTAATSFCGRGSSKRSVLTCHGHSI